MSSNLNFYYLYKYGTPTGSGYSSLTNGGAVQSNNFVGAMLQYNRFDLNGTMDFVTDNTEDSTSDDNYTNFYNSYKSVVGSDVMSYMNKYANTDSMALGDMVNTKEGTNPSYIDNLTADKQTFGFHTTKDGDPYRFTFGGTADALQDISGDSSADFTDLSKSYQEYANYVTEKLAGSTTATLSGSTSAVDLSKLGIDYATILAKVGDATTAKAIYQNLIDQFVTEATALKAGTISSDNLATMDRDLDDKQRGLKSIDDELFGYVEKGAAVSTSKTSYSLTNAINATSFSGAGKTAIANASTSYGITGSGTTNATSLLDYIGNISVSGQGTPAGAVSAFTDQLKIKVGQWVEKNLNTAAATPFSPIAATTAAAPVVTSTDANVSNYLSTAASNASVPTDTLANIKTWVTNNATQTYTDEKAGTTQSVTLAGAEIDNAANLLWNSIATSSFTTKAQFTSFVSTSYGASTPANLGSPDQDNATNILYRNYLAKAQKDSYIADLTTAIMNNVSNTQAQTDTETTLIQNMDITTRNADNNYSDAGGAMYLDDASDLKSLVNNIFNDTKNLGYHKIPHWYGDNIYLADNYAIPGENVVLALTKMGINITKNADGTGIVDTTRGTTWDECNTSSAGYSGSYVANGQAAMYDAINNGSVTLINDKDGKFHFDYNGKTYYINTKVACDLANGISSTIDADGVAGTIEGFTRGGDYRGAITNDVKNAFASGKVSGGTGSLDLRHLKVTDPTKGAVLTLNGTNDLTVASKAATQTFNSGSFSDFSAASAFNMGTDSTAVTYDSNGNETDTPYSSTTSPNVTASTATTQTLQYQYNLTNFPFTEDGYLFQTKAELAIYKQVKNGTADFGTIAHAWTNPVVTQTQTWDANGGTPDNSGNYPGAWVNGAESYTATAVEIKSNVKLNTDPNSLVYQLASSLVTSSDIVGTGIAGQADPTPKQKQEFAIYLSEVSAAIMEQYWIENFNKSDAEPIDKYFARQFSSYLNASATSANKDFNFVDSDNQIAHFAINFDEDPAKTNIVDKILEKQSWAQMYAKMEDRSRTEMSLFEEATSMDTVANINNKEYEYRMALLEAMQKESDAKTLDMDFSKVNKNLVTEGAGAEKNPWWSSYFPWFKGTYGNLPDGATPSDMFDASGHLTMSYGNNVDPYLVKINNVDYVMGKDDDQDGEITSSKEILGITDTVDTSFTSLKALDTNKDGFVSQDELKAQHIIFKAMNSSDRMNGSSISSDFIRGIDLSTLEKGDGTNNIYGLFNVQLTNGQKAAAVQTFESQSYFNNLFGDYADMSFLNNTKANTTTAAPAAATTVTTAKTSTPAATTATNTEDANTKEMLLGKNFNFFTYLNNTTSDDSSATKTPALTDSSDDTILVDDKEVSLSSLVDEFCWKFDVNKITAKQKYNILGGVDTSKSSDIIVKKIEDEVSKLHTEFSA